MTRVGSKDELLKLPMTGVGLLLLNLGLGFVAHSWERMVGYVLLLAAIGAEAILLAAAIIALHWLQRRTHLATPRWHSRPRLRSPALQPTLRCVDFIDD